jgi:uncharacterized protein YlxW (UPF0749 family)
MSLLADLQTHSMDGGYAAAGARRRARPVTGLVVTAVLGLLITTAALDVRERQEDLAGNGRTDLVREVRERTASVAAQQDDLERLRADLRALREDQLSLTATGSAGAAGLERLGMITGEIPVRGPGVEVRLDDARPESGLDQLDTNDPRAQEDMEGSRVRDLDVQVTVNGLWAAGAEAITVNGQRLTALTSIRAAGAAILVDYQPLARPYVVHAVGDPDKLEAGFADGLAGRWLASAADNAGVRYAVSQQERLTLPGAATITLRHASPPSASPTTSTTSTTSTGSKFAALAAEPGGPP